MSNIPPSLPPQASSPLGASSPLYQEWMDLQKAIQTSISQWSGIDAKFDKFIDDIKNSGYSGLPFYDPSAVGAGKNPWLQSWDPNTGATTTHSNPPYNMVQAAGELKYQFDTMWALYLQSGGINEKIESLSNVMYDNWDRMTDILRSPPAR